MRRITQSLLAAASLTIIVTGAAPTSGLSQQPAATSVTTRAFVQVIRLKPDMVREWIDLQRNEVIPAQKKAGLASRTTLVTALGNAFEYTIITPFATWAAMDGPAPLVRALGAEGAAQLNAKLRKSILTQQSYMTNRVDSLTIPAGDAPIWRVAVRRVLPGKMQDYLAYYRAEVLPGLQQAKAAGKIAGSTVAVRGAGAQSGEFTTVTFYAKFADLEAGNPLVQVLGRDSAARINAKNPLYSTATQVVIKRRLADLSF